MTALRQLSKRASVSFLRIHWIKQRKKGIYLFLLLKKELDLHFSTSLPDGQDATYYQDHSRENGKELIFYDIVDGQYLKPAGIEIQLSPDEAKLPKHAYIIYDPYPRIMFRQVDFATTRGLCAFGGISFWNSNIGDLLICIETDDLMDFSILMKYINII